MPSMIIKGSAPRENPPVGMQLGRCIKLIDLGTQSVEWQGSVKHQHKIVISFELPTCFMEGIYQPELKGKPFGISRRFTMSLRKNSALKDVLQSWRGKPFTKEEEASFDIGTVLGVPCMLNLVASESGEFVNINSVTSVPKEMRKNIPAQINPSVLFSLDPASFDPKVFGSLGQYYQDLITPTPEYSKLFAEPEPLEAVTAGASEGPAPEGDDSFPF